VCVYISVERYIFIYKTWNWENERKRVWNESKFIKFVEQEKNGIK